MLLDFRDYVIHRIELMKKVNQTSLAGESKVNSSQTVGLKLGTLLMPGLPQIVVYQRGLNRLILNLDDLVHELTHKLNVRVVVLSMENYTIYQQVVLKTGVDDV